MSSPACRQQGSAPLTFLQQARLERSRQARAAGSAPRSNLVTDAVSITGPLDADRLQRAAGEVRRRQPALRSRFADDHQVLAPCQGADLPPPRLDRHPTAPAEFATDGPERFALFLRQIEPHQHELTLAADHLVFDARSLEIFWENLWSAYLAPGPEEGCRCESGYLELLTAPTRLSDRCRERTEFLTALLKQRQSSFGYLDLPVRLGLDSVGSRQVSVVSQPVPAETHQRVAELARLRRTTVFAVVTAASFAAIRDVSGADTALLYTFLENRRSVSARRAIGWFAATTLLASNGPDGAGEGDEVEQAKKVLLDALICGGQSTEEVHRACGAGARHATLPSVSLSAGPAVGEAVTLGELEVTGVSAMDDPTGSVPRGRIAIEYWPQLIQLSYETDRFDAATVQALGNAVRRQLERLVR